MSLNKGDRVRLNERFLGQTQMRRLWAGVVMEVVKVEGVLITVRRPALYRRRVAGKRTSRAKYQNRFHRDFLEKVEE